MTARFLMVTIIAITACRPEQEIPNPTYAFVLPKSNYYWANEIKKGFEAVSKQFHLKYEIKEYNPDSADSAIEQTLDVKNQLSTAACIVFTNKNIIQNVSKKLSEHNKQMITVGEDDILVKRVGHIGMATTQMAYHWAIRLSQQSPAPQKVLLLIGDVPINKERIIGAIYTRSDKWKKFKLRTRTTQNVTTDDFKWAQLVTPIGQDAVEICVTEKVVDMIPIDGSDYTLGLLRAGACNIIFAPNYFQLGYRAGRIAREYYMQGFLDNPVIELKYDEVDKEYLPYFLKKRYEIPPVSLRDIENKK
jgi:hypothetical protein